MKIKVAEIITDTNIGGAGRLLLCRLNVMNRECFEETVIVPLGSDLEERFRELGINCLTMKCCFDRSFDIRGIFYLYKIFKKINPDIINAHGCLSARIAAYLAKISVKIYTRHCAFDPRFLMKVFPIKNIKKKTVIEFFQFKMIFVKEGWGVIVLAIGNLTIGEDGVEGIREIPLIQ